MNETPFLRIVVFGATGRVGEQVLSQLEETGWPIAELVGVVSADSTTAEFEFLGEAVSTVTKWPTFRAGDLAFVCTPGQVTHEIVRSALQAGVACIDCTGVMSQHAEVPMPVRDRELASDAVALAPLLASPSATTLAWTPLLEALESAVGIARVVATVLSSASVRGRHGLIALSEESIALFNQSEGPEVGPAGQPVAFDVIPGGIDEARVAVELARVFDSKLRVDLTSLQVPTFIGEGAALAIELSSPLDEAVFAKLLGGVQGLTLVEEGVGTRELAAVDPDAPEPTGPTLRDSASSESILVGRIRPDASLPVGIGWRLWLAYEPLRIVAQHAIRLASLRLSGR